MMSNHVHTKSANADKIQALINAVHRLNDNCGIVPQNVLTIKLESLASLATEADHSLVELKDQTGIT